MKAHKPNTDQEVDFRVRANGVLCNEYVLRSETNNNDSNELTCFIPVNEGDRLTITGSFTGSVLHASFDLLADGNFVASKRVGRAKAAKIRHYQELKEDIKTIFSAVEPDSLDFPAQPKHLVEGQLRVTAHN